MRASRLMLPAMLTLLAACGGDPIPREDAFLRVTTPSRSVELGLAFPLTVQRLWERGGAPMEFREDMLAPLEVRLVDTRLREDEARTEETRRYVAYAFAPGVLSLSLPSGETLRLIVHHAVDTAKPGAPELPGDPPPAPLPLGPWLAAAAAAAIAVALLVLRSRRPRAAPLPAPGPPPPPPPHEIALARIAALRLKSPESREESERWHVDVADLLRAYVAANSGIPSRIMTTEEVAAATRAPRLSRVLRACDLVKFARGLPGAAEREETLDLAEAYVRESAP